MIGGPETRAANFAKSNSLIRSRLIHHGSLPERMKHWEYFTGSCWKQIDAASSFLGAFTLSSIKFMSRVTEKEAKQVVTLHLTEQHQCGDLMVECFAMSGSRLAVFRVKPRSATRDLCDELGKELQVDPWSLCLVTACGKRLSPGSRLSMRKFADQSDAASL